MLQADVTPSSEVQRALRLFVQEATGVLAEDAALTTLPIAGGLESEAVYSVCARRRAGPRCFNFVAKIVSGSAVRESRVYGALAASPARGVSPRFYAARELSDERHILFLQRIRRARSWPWRDIEAAGSILDSLALLHQSLASQRDDWLADWDYDRELTDMALRTLELLERTRLDPSLSALSRSLPAARRIVASLTPMRQQLLAAAPDGVTAVHGDVHPGNVLLRRSRTGLRPVLIDWARARAASPLEDVHSWLHSLGFWEPEARRRHDTLMARYLIAMGRGGRFDMDLRAAYWLAGACNALAGVLVHHLPRVLDAQLSGAARSDAFGASTSWLRVLRRADAYWRR